MLLRLFALGFFVQKRQAHPGLFDLAPQKNIFMDGHIAGQRKVLVDHLNADVPRFARALKPHIAAFKQQRAFAGRVQPGEHLHQGRFTRAVVAHHAQHLALGDLQADIAQRRDRTEKFGHAARLQDGRGCRVGRAHKLQGVPLCCAALGPVA